MDGASFNDEVWKSIDDLQKAMEAVPHAVEPEPGHHRAQLIGRGTKLFGGANGSGGPP
jgi:hypothetical protein